MPAKKSAPKNSKSFEKTLWDTANKLRAHETLFIDARKMEGQNTESPGTDNSWNTGLNRVGSKKCPA